MSKSKKYEHITDAEIESCLDQGLYRKDGTIIRNVETGEIVKIQPKTEVGNNLIPATLIQVNSTNIYQADLSPIINEIVTNRHIDGFNDLEEKYNIVVDLLDAYLNYKKHLPDLLKECLMASVMFDNRIRRYLVDFDLEEIETYNIEQFIGAVSAYVKVLFVYLLSSYMEYRVELKNDKTIISKISNLENMLRETYEQILVPSTVEENICRMNMSESLYALYCFDDDYDIYELDNLVSYDSRFSSSLDVISFFKRVHKKEYSNDIYNYNSHRWIKASNFQIGLSVKKHDKNTNRNKIINMLVLVFQELEKLKTIRNELIETGSNEEVFEVILSSVKCG